MRYRSLGKTGVQVSEVGFGVWTLSTGWWGEVDDERSVSLLRRAFEKGIDYFDTADTYGSGKGETLLADAFGGMREEIVISTKIGYDFYNHPQRRGQQERPQDWSEDFIRFALEQSLKRLRTDYVDLLQLHNTKMDAIENDALFELMEEFEREGKIRSYGVALGPKIGWLEEGTYPGANGPEVRPRLPGDRLDPAEHLRRGAARGVRCGARYPGSRAGGALPHRGALREQLRIGGFRHQALGVRQELR
jgi:hypothetical protein